MMHLSIRNRFILLTSAYSLLLMGGLLLFFDLNGKKELEKQAIRQIADKFDLFHQTMQMEIKNTSFELDILSSKLATLEDSNENLNDLAHPLLDNFFINYPYKYNRILWKHPHSPWLEIKSFHEMDANEVIIETLHKKMADTQKNRLIMGNQGYMLHCYPSGIYNQPSQLFAEIHFSNCLDRIISQIGLSLPYDYFISDTTGLVRYATDLYNINQNITSIVDGQTPYFLHLTQQIPDSNLQLTIRKNVSSEFMAWRNKLKQGAAFSLILILMAIIVSAIIGHRIRRSIQEVSNRALEVAGGQFDVTLPSERHDEFGGLFNAFNQMTQNLKTSYDDLKRMNQELEIKIDELRNTRLELSKKQRLALLGEAISKISHEIQNKIGGVHIWVQNIERILPHDENAQLHLHELKKALSSLMDRLIHFKRFYREPELHKTSVDICQWLQKITEAHALEFKNKDIHVELNIDPLLPEVNMDIVQMEDAMVNLLLNAVYASPSGGTVTLSAQEKDKKIHLSVQDEGPGIEEECETLFQPFYTTKASGSGLGLSIVQKIVHAHHGHITCSNVPTKGAVFTITLPPAEKIKGE